MVDWLSQWSFYLCQKHNIPIFSFCFGFLFFLNIRRSKSWYYIDIIVNNFEREVACHDIKNSGVGMAFVYSWEMILVLFACVSVLALVGVLQARMFSGDDGQNVESFLKAGGFSDGMLGSRLVNSGDIKIDMFGCYFSFLMNVMGIGSVANDLKAADMPANAFLKFEALEIRAPSLDAPLVCHNYCFLWMQP